MPQYGINLDPNNPAGLPIQPGDLKGLQWVRMAFQITPHTHRTLEESLKFYEGYIDPLNSLGIRTLLILNQQTYVGNAPWMHSDDSWKEYSKEFSKMSGVIAEHFKDKSVAYQIWNEQDQGSQSAIYVAPKDFAALLNTVYDKIHTYDESATVVIGGLCSGNPNGYLKQVRDTLHGNLPADAIGIHPYGKEPNGSNSLMTHLKPVIDTFVGCPIWITEISKHPILPNYYDAVARYIREIDISLDSETLKQVQVLMWYCWSDGMNPGFGITDANLVPKGNVYQTFFEVAKNGTELKEELPCEDTDAPKEFENQDLINAFYKAAHSLGESPWDWMERAGLDKVLIANRTDIYKGKAINELPGLTKTEKGLLNCALANKPLQSSNLSEAVTDESLSQNILNVHWISQMNAAGWGNNDCGDACVLMQLWFYNYPTVSREEFFKIFSGTTSHADLSNLASRFGMTLKSESAEIDDLPDLIDQQKPTILLVNYKDLKFPPHLSKDDQGLHWILIVGYRGTEFFVHDPLWMPADRDGRGGAYLTIDKVQLGIALIRSSQMLYRAE